jgi:hypothetical protein
MLPVLSRWPHSLPLPAPQEAKEHGSSGGQVQTVTNPTWGPTQGPLSVTSASRELVALHRALCDATAALERIGVVREVCAVHWGWWQ